MTSQPTPLSRLSLTLSSFPLFRFQQSDKKNIILKSKICILTETTGKEQRYSHSMERTYLNEKHRQYSEACQQEVREMMDHPLSREEKEEQMRRNRRRDR